MIQIKICIYAFINILLPTFLECGEPIEPGLLQTEGALQFLKGEEGGNVARIKDNLK